MAFIPNKIQMVPGTPPSDKTLYFGDVYVGVDTQKTYGPTSVTNWYNGYQVPTGGYVTYLNKGSIDPSIYMCNSDSDLIENVNQVFGANAVSVTQALDVYYQESDALCVNFDYDDLECENLQMAFDFGYTPCYVRQGTSFRPFGKIIGAGGINNTFAFTTIGSNNQTGEVYFQNTGTQNEGVQINFQGSGVQFKTLSIWYRPGTSSTIPYFLFECNGSVSDIFLADSTTGPGPGLTSALISEDGGNFTSLTNAGQYMFNDNSVHNIIIIFNAGTTNVTAMRFLNNLNDSKGMNGGILAAFAWDKVFTNDDATRHYNALQSRLV